MSLDVHIPREMEAYVRAKVEAGLYESPSQMVSMALQVLEERESLKTLRAEIQKGMESGPGIPAEEAFHRLEKKYLSLLESRIQ